MSSFAIVYSSTDASGSAWPMTTWLPAADAVSAAPSVPVLTTYTNMDGSRTTYTSWALSPTPTPSQVYQGPIGGYVPANSAPGSSSAYLQSVIISLIALAVILVVSIIFLYYRRQRLHRYAAADWPFPPAFRSNARGGGVDPGEKPTMWEVEVGEEKSGVEEKAGLDSEWRPLSAHAIPPAEVDSPTPPAPAPFPPPSRSRNPLSRLRQTPPAPASSPPLKSTDSSSASAVDTPAEPYAIGTQLQVSVLIAMPVPPAVQERRRSRAMSVSRPGGLGGEAGEEEEQELPEMQIGYAEMRIAEEEGSGAGRMPSDGDLGNRAGLAVRQ